MAKSCSDCKHVSSYYKTLFAGARTPDRTHAHEKRINRSSSNPNTKTMKYGESLASIGGGIGEELLSDYGFTYVDNLLGRTALPIWEQARPWLDFAVAALGVVVSAEYGDKLGKHGDSALIGAATVAAAHDVRIVSSLAGLRPPLPKRYQRAGMRQQQALPQYVTGYNPLIGNIVY